jgi:hypothetical protein
MPQANITYDAPYNRGMVNFIEELDKKHWEKAYPAYHPNPMGFRLGSFHGEPVSQIKVGGGSSPLKYNPAGNSSAYPPMNLSTGLAVSSGGSFHQGARYSGVDGAIGMPHPALAGAGANFNPFDMGYKLGHDVIGPALMKLGKGRKPRAKKGGKLPSIGDVFKGVARVAEPIAKDIGTKMIMKAVGLGRKPRAKKGGEISGGKGFDFLGAVKSIGHAVGEPVGMATEALAKATLGKALGLGRKKGGAISGGAISGGASRGRSVRAEIVKKVMREKGLKMIEASKYVKAHNLY